MKRDRLGRFLSPGAAGPRGGSGGGSGSGRTRGRPSRSGPSVDEAAALVAARLGWGLARARGDPGEDGADEAGTGRALAMGHCRLCHGKFSSRSLRSISGRSPGESSDRPPPGERVFIRDFQHLLGVAVHQDPALSQFVCKNCHAQFYQCHGLLKSFLQRVNVSPTGPRKTGTKVGAKPPPGAEEGACLVDLITSSPQGLRDLVAWVHGHAASCGALPNLQRTLSSEYCGVIQAVWGCDQGHDYTMDADSSCGALLLDSALAVKWTWDKEMAPWLTQHRGSNPTGAAPQSSQGRATTAPAETETLPSTDMAHPSSDVNPVGPGLGPSPRPSFPSSGAPGRLGEKQVPSSTSDDRVKDEFSDLSEGDILSEDENDKKQNAQSSDESFEPYAEKKVPAGASTLHFLLLPCRGPWRLGPSPAVALRSASGTDFYTTSLSRCLCGLVWTFPFRGSLAKRVKAKKPRSLKNQEFGRNPAPSQAGRTSRAVRGRSCPPSTSALTRAARLCTEGPTA
ncbi:zinc finger protein 276 isoform X3 [Mustela erminea]|uniref:zinc finger protein 276 isoform X3 n=1 Tax=Mustela erminea TaxID=36723 RepID=UPI0013875ECD|nr:zinc finger protein 276 isoform X3 [Mustela erminea]